jgi:hypothetical protein
MKARRFAPSRGEARIVIGRMICAIEALAWLHPRGASAANAVNRCRYLAAESQGASTYKVRYCWKSFK